MSAWCNFARNRVGLKIESRRILSSCRISLREFFRESERLFRRPVDFERSYREGNGIVSHTHRSAFGRRKASALHVFPNRAAADTSCARPALVTARECPKVVSRFLPHNNNKKRKKTNAYVYPLSPEVKTRRTTHTAVLLPGKAEINISPAASAFFFSGTLNAAGNKIIFIVRTTNTMNHPPFPPCFNIIKKKKKNTKTKTNYQYRKTESRIYILTLKKNKNKYKNWRVPSEACPVDRGLRLQREGYRVLCRRRAKPDDTGEDRRRRRRRRRLRRRRGRRGILARGSHSHRDRTRERIVRMRGWRGGREGMKTKR